MNMDFPGNSTEILKFYNLLTNYNLQVTMLVNTRIFAKGIGITSSRKLTIF